jgi:hypothetical protein
MNDSNNNFSLIRNAEINRIGPRFISPIYFEKFDINDQMKQRNAYEDEKYINHHSKIWERNQDTYEHKYCNIIVNNDYDKQFCIIGFDSLLENIERISKLYENTRNDFIILENKCRIEYLQERIERYNFQRMKCYTLIDTPNDQLINYFKLLYLSVSNYEIIDSNIQKPIYNTKAYNRSQIINQLTNSNDRYLEIGVEYGECFNEVHFINKIGVDPDPKFNPTNGKLFKLTSDDYFIQYNNEDTSSIDSDDIIDEPPIFDVIFIDGMHQTEYILKDINNSLRILSDKGIIFIDDILPLNYNEQLKVPIKHYYENGILKYGENWTGDIWKVIYHILKNYKDHIKMFKYYYNINFRGIGMFKFEEGLQINPCDIDIINNYSYFNDFTDYLTLLQSH